MPLSFCEAPSVVCAFPAAAVGEGEPFPPVAGAEEPESPETAVPEGKDAEPVIAGPNESLGDARLEMGPPGKV